MITEEKIIKEVRWLEKEVNGMHHPTKTAFLKAITEFKQRLEDTDSEIEIPEWMTTFKGNIQA